ncbi:MAG: PadR family transcriptional regulator [Gemmatimonadetes bacterium]|nr:PadR family transcriptional regulator [Gemmatimonadota bacterium]
MKPAPDPEGFLPLTHLSFQILLALADQDRHGYGMIKEIVHRTAGRIRPGTGTLYTAIGRMLDEGTIMESPTRPAPDEDDERRKYYSLTVLGREVARAEALRLAGLVRVASEKKLVPELISHQAPK